MLSCRSRPFLILAFAVAVAACDSVVEPHATLPVEFTFGIHRPAHEPAFLIHSGADAVVVRGFFRTPCQPYDARASVTVSEGTLMLHIRGERSGDCPQDAVVSVGYQAILRTPPSEYTRLRVRHEWKDADWPAEMAVDTVLSTR